MTRKFYRPPDESERTVFFNYLKQGTSLSAWRRAYSYHEKLFREIEKAFLDPSNGDSVNGRRFIFDSEIRGFRRSLSAFALALERLEAGNRRCFRWAFSPGHFSEGLRYPEVWDDDLYRWLFQGGAEFTAAQSPFWSEIWHALRDATSASNVGLDMLEPRHTDVTATLQGPKFSFEDIPGNPVVWLRNNLANLPPAPKLKPGDPTMIIKSGQTIPYYGIWEPCEASATSSLFNRVIGRMEPLSADVKVNTEGCMNYLHQGSNAPNIAFPGDDYRQYGRSTHWYLLWADDRYGENPIPEEESGYTYPPVEEFMFTPMN